MRRVFDFLKKRICLTFCWCWQNVLAVIFATLGLAVGMLVYSKTGEFVAKHPAVAGVYPVITMSPVAFMYALGHVLDLWRCYGRRATNA